MLVREPESRFTPPREECPFPDRWTSNDVDSTEHEISYLVGAFIVALQPDFCVETGTAFGQTAVEIGKALKLNGQGELFSFEIDASRFISSVNKITENDLPVTIFQRSSLDFNPTKQIDFAWFDSYCEIRATEFLHYYPKMHSSTVVGFHDTGPQHGPMKSTVDKLADDGYIQPMFLPTPRGVCFARVLSTNVKVVTA